MPNSDTQIQYHDQFRESKMSISVIRLFEILNTASAYLGFCLDLTLGLTLCCELDLEFVKYLPSN